MLRGTSCSLRAFVITETKLMLMAAAAKIGLKSSSNTGKSTPAAIGTPNRAQVLRDSNGQVFGATRLRAPGFRGHDLDRFEETNRLYAESTSQAHDRIEGSWSHVLVLNPERLSRMTASSLP